MYALEYKLELISKLTDPDTEWNLNLLNSTYVQIAANQKHANLKKYPLACAHNTRPLAALKPVAEKIGCAR
jgi:hypothetical protein